MPSDTKTRTDDLNVSAFTPDLREVRTFLELKIKEGSFVALIAAVLYLIGRMCKYNAELMTRIAQLTRRRPKSETLERVEQQLAFAFPQVTASRAKPAAEQPEKPKQSRRGRHPGRAALPEHLPRVDVPNLLPSEMCACPECGSEMTRLPFDVTEILEVEPAKLYVIRRLTECRACPHDDCIVRASPPPELVERGVLGPKLIVESMADKYLEHLPIERQVLRWKRAGVSIAPQTLGRSVGLAVDLLEPIAQLIRDRTRARALLAVDATGLPVLDKDAPDGIRTGTIWCWIGDARWVTFVYSPVGDSASVRKFLGEDLRRVVQCDGANVTTFLERAGGKRPGCWAHARRRLVVAARGGDLLALEALRITRRIFAVDRLSRIAGDTAEQRKARRAEHTAPTLAELRKWVTEKRQFIPPKTPLGKALNYLHRQWPRLVLFLEDGNIELTNNQVERELRRLVLGRKNWLFVWEDVGGERTASILTVVGTCIAQGVSPRAYLHLVTKLIIEGWPQAKLAELLPEALAATHPELRVHARPSLPLLVTEAPILPAAA